MIGLLGIVFAPIIAGALIAAALSAATQIAWHKFVTKPQQEETKKRVEEASDKQEAKAKLIALKQRNQMLASFTRGTVYAKKELLDARRDRQAELTRSYGVPERS